MVPIVCVSVISTYLLLIFYLCLRVLGVIGTVTDPESAWVAACAPRRASGLPYRPRGTPRARSWQKGRMQCARSVGAVRWRAAGGVGVGRGIESCQSAETSAQTRQQTPRQRQRRRQRRQGQTASSWWTRASTPRGPPRNYQSRPAPPGCPGPGWRFVTWQRSRRRTQPQAWRSPLAA